MVPVQWKAFQYILKQMYIHDDLPEVFLCTTNVDCVFQLMQVHFQVMTVYKLLLPHPHQNQCFRLLSITNTN